jgi:hypothetical protein
MNSNPSTKKASLYVWGNHHISDKNDFQAILHHSVLKNTTQFYSPDFHIDPSLTRDAIEELKLNLRPWPSILVIVFSDTNLLNLDSLISFLNNYQKIYSSFSYQPNYKLITCGMIPSRITSEHKDLLIKQFDFNLKKLQQAYDGIFISLLDKFEPEDYDTNDTLNHHGNLKFAKILTDALVVLEQKHIMKTLVHQEQEEDA